MMDGAVGGELLIFDHKEGGVVVAMVVALLREVGGDCPW